MAIHKETGFARAIKFINKKKLNQYEVEKLINEVEILRKLVIIIFLLFKILQISIKLIKGSS